MCIYTDIAYYFDFFDIYINNCILIIYACIIMLLSKFLT